MNKTKIEWCDMTWNPVTGCRRGCSYCYAKKIHNRFSKTPFEEIEYHEGRMQEPMKVKEPKKIFVGSMSDIEYWPHWLLQEVLEVAKKCPQHTFMFLSKERLAYSRWNTWPENTMQGLTVTKVEIWCEYLRIEKMQEDVPRPFVSIEPLMGPVLRWAKKDRSELVIVGAMTGPGAVKPKDEWIESIVSMVPGNKLFWKGSIDKQANKIIERRAK